MFAQICAGGSSWGDWGGGLLGVKRTFKFIQPPPGLMPPRLLPKLSETIMG